MRFFLLVLLFASQVSFAATAVPRTIDFQNLEFAGFGAAFFDELPASVDPQYHFTAGIDYGFNDWGSWGTSSTNYAGSTGVFVNSNISTIIERYDGLAFTLESIELAFLSGGVLSNKSTTIEFFAIDENGPTGHSQSFTLYGSDPFVFYNFNFDSGFEDVTRVWWREEDNLMENIQFDNVVVTAVPVPAAVWLFGSALAGLGWMRRKQAT
ncbi:MAG: VPLPA-CTERM sorting domain-containing protein [Gammaproteobacteria bacterium]|nr:VPLPA-CTERM sorting domain-containing protein [Gammaproteobacteria bacterium]MCP4928100.1 VPLPA-CTERM sorting domain-containing protein [Gammaproteobacteria bacterium]